MIDPDARIHASAELGKDVSIGARTTVLQRAEVRDGASVGADASIGRDAFIDRGVRIGSAVRIDHGAMLFAGLTVEDAVVVGPGAIVTNERYPRALDPSGTIVRDADRQLSPVTLRLGSSIGAGAVVVAGVEVGRFAMVGAGGVVTRDVPAHALVAGSPAERIGWVCACGTRLVDSNGDAAPAAPAHYAIDAALTCERCGRTYRYVPDGETLVEVTATPQAAPA